MNSHRLYFAGDLFSAKDLLGNAALAEAIYSQSGQTLLPILPQTIEHRDSSPRSIRDRNLATLLSCDVALFNFDGLELDSGTVVEFLIAKWADIPSLLLRTDFRFSGDQGSAPGAEPWNLMCSGFPRTSTLLINPLEWGGPLLPHDQDEPHQEMLSQRRASAHINSKLHDIAAEVCSHLRRLLSHPPTIDPREKADLLTRIIPMLCGFAQASGEPHSPHVAL